MNRQEASLYFRLSVVPYSPGPPNKAMQTDGRFATAADRQGVGRTHNAGEEPMHPDRDLLSLIEASWSAGRLPCNAPGRQEP
jgi:hypothetical protein